MTEKNMVKEAAEEENSFFAPKTDKNIYSKDMGGQEISLGKYYEVSLEK